MRPSSSLSLRVLTGKYFGCSVLAFPNLGLGLNQVLNFEFFSAFRANFRDRRVLLPSRESRSKEIRASW